MTLNIWQYKASPGFKDGEDKDIQLALHPNNRQHFIDQLKRLQTGHPDAQHFPLAEMRSAPQHLDNANEKFDYPRHQFKSLIIKKKEGVEDLIIIETNEHSRAIGIEATAKGIGRLLQNLENVTKFANVYANKTKVLFENETDRRHDYKEAQLVFWGVTAEGKAIFY